MNKVQKNSPITQAQLQQRDKMPPSLLRHLPWVDFIDEENAVVLHDGSVGAVFEVSQVAFDACPESVIIAFRDGLHGLLQDVFPLHEDGNRESPWVLQCYVEKIPSLTSHLKRFYDYIPAARHASRCTQSFLKLMRLHCEWMTKPEGIFIDEKVSGMAYRGGLFTVRFAVYRKNTPNRRGHQSRCALGELSTVCQRLEAKCREMGIKTLRYTRQQFSDWLIRWFNPAPTVTGGDVNALLGLLKKPMDFDTSHSNRKAGHSAAVNGKVSPLTPPFGCDFAEGLFFAVPRSNQENGCWYFDKLPHRYLSIQSLRQVPTIGHLSFEHRQGHGRFAVLDKLPEGSVFVMTTVLQSPALVKSHLAALEYNACKVNSTTAAMVLEDCLIAKAALENGHLLFPVSMGVYLKGETDADLAKKTLETEALLIGQGFQTWSDAHELTPLHSYLNQLPFCYDHALDQRCHYRSHYVFSQQVANLLPLYGRSTGTGNTGVTFWNRGGEPLTFDPLSPKDKDNNSYLLLLGAAGSGKSSTSVYLLMQAIAIYNPRLVIVDAGNSFGLLADYFAEQGLSVHRVRVDLNNPPVLNPFANAKAMLQQWEKLQTEQALQSEIRNKEKIESNQNTDQSVEALRDYMGEMVLACQLMITGGEKKEWEAMTRQDRLYIVEALVQAAQKAVAGGRDQMLARDIVAAFRQQAAQLEKQTALSKLPNQKLQRLQAMADSLDFFCQDALSSQIFNREGQPWPMADITIFEQGTFKDSGYEAHNVLAFMGLMSRTMAQAEAHQYKERQTIVFADEVHTLLKVPLSAAYLTQCAKMSRKLGLWLWMATQNVNDFDGDSKKILSMVEFWLCLGLSENEIKTLETFRQLTDEEKILFRSVRKSAGQYVEGVLLCPKLKALFRNIPPRLCLALAMTEKTEKAQRKALMEKYQITELQAVQRIAESMQ